MSDLLNKVTQGDCLEVMREIPDKSVDYVITSPPYNLGGDFHTMIAGKRVSYGGYASKKNDNMAEQDYQDWQLRVLSELYRTLKDDGVLFYNHKNRIKNGSIISPYEWVIKTEFNISQVVVLNFKSTANVDKRRFFPVHELLFVLTKSPETKLKNNECLTDVWEMKKVPRKRSGHPATFHEILPQRCLSAVNIESDTIVLDPFTGTGTTLKVAKSLGCNYIGIEIERSYANMAREALL